MHNAIFKRDLNKFLCDLFSVSLYIFIVDPNFYCYLFLYLILGDFFVNCFYVLFKRTP